jgi:predicted deacylase
MHAISRCVLPITVVCGFLGFSSALQASVRDGETVIVGDVSIDAGTKKSWDLHAGETALGPVKIPVTVINGIKKGPHLAVTAACHPMELTGIMATIRLAKEIDPEKLAGALLIVHVQNIMGFQAKQGHLSPLDGINMSRAFRARDDIDESGTVSHQGKSLTFLIADRVFSEIISRSDYYIDLHGGELHESLVPNIEILPVGIKETDDKIRSLARAFGFDLIWEVPKGSIVEMPDYPGSGMAALEAAKSGIPSAVCEVGSEGKLEEALVDLMLEGIVNVMTELEMLAGEKVPDEARVLVGGNVLFAKRAGLFLTKVKSGDQLSKGQTLGHILELSGEVVETFEAPRDGILLNMVTLGVANPGDMLYVIGNIVE